MKKPSTTKKPAAPKPDKANVTPEKASDVGASAPDVAGTETASVVATDVAGKTAGVVISREGVDDGADVQAATPLTKRDQAASSGASIIVSTKAPLGRRRAGCAFSREDTTIPLADLSQEQLDAIKGDDALIVKPG